MSRFAQIVSFVLVLVAVSSARADLPVFKSSRAFALLEKQCGFGPRNPGSEGYRQCREWLARELGGLTAEIYRQEFEAVEALTGEKRSFTNIIARFAAGNGAPLMLCAHWDTRAHADHDPDPANHTKPILGANDGASGVAVLLEIAAILSDFPPPRTIIIALFDGEDIGRPSVPSDFSMGSKHWAEHQVPEPPGEAILLDMIGDADLEVPIEPFSENFAPHLRKSLWDIAASLELGAFQDRLGPPVQDDHLPLLAVGIPAVNLIDFDYPYWHTISDTPDKCSPESLGQVGRLLIAFIYGGGG